MHRFAQVVVNPTTIRSRPRRPLPYYHIRIDKLFTRSITTTKSWTDVVTSLMSLWFCLDAPQLQQPLPLFDIIGLCFEFRYVR
jgi:hypothetical protein